MGGRMLNGGHRGNGWNLMEADGHVYPAQRENTLKSFEAAAGHGVDFVEFDVQVTKDGVPIVWHDDQILYGEDVAHPTHHMIKDLTVQELQAIFSSGKPIYRRFHARSPGCPQRPGLEQWACAEEGPAPTLAALFAALPASCGFDIEVKMSEGAELAATPKEEVERMLSHILPVVEQEVEKGGRAVLFSCFDPDVCSELKKRIPGVPTWFLSEAGHSPHADPRRASFDAAVAFASQAGLAGVVIPASVLLRDEAAMVKALRDSRLGVMTYGPENDDLAAVARQSVAGATGVIIDEVATVMSGLRAQQQQAAAGAVAVAAK